MRTKDFLSLLISLDIRVWEENGALRYSAPQGVMNERLREELSIHKKDILKLFKEQRSSRMPYGSPIKPASRNGQIPLSFAQQRLWFLDQFGGDNSAYRMERVYKLSGKLVIPFLEKSIDELIRRHEILRTVFYANDGIPYQRILKYCRFDLPVIDLERFSTSEKESEAQRLIRESSKRPFDLGEGPLLRTHLYRLKVNDYLFHISMHHIIYDAWSMEIFFREFSTIYTALNERIQHTLPELPIQYADFAVWQNEGQYEEKFSEQLNYWKQQLGGESFTLQLPFDRTRPAQQTFRGANEIKKLPFPLTKKLKRLSFQEDTTLFMTLLAAFYVLLSRLTGQEDIAVGTLIANRNRTEIEKLIGFFVNTLVLRTHLNGNPTFRELLMRVREVTLDAYTNQDLPFEKLVEVLDPERELSHTPLFQVMFILQNTPTIHFTLPGLTISRQKSGSSVSRFDLSLYVAEGENGLDIRFNYRTDLFEAATIARIFDYYKNLLTDIAEHPNRPISHLRLLSDKDKYQFKTPVSDVHLKKEYAEFVFEAEGTIAQRFVKQVHKYPNDIAVKTGNYQWTYEVLNRKANQVAGAFLSSRQQASKIVALLFRHDAPMLAGIMGALKAGKTYVPLDPYYPQERLGYILKDSSADLIVANNETVELARKLRRVSDIEIINIDDLSTEYQVEDSGFTISPHDLAYILYTSGTTGEPKGVMQNHRNVLHHIRVYTNNLHINHNERLSLLSTYSFDAAVMDIFGALLNGAALYPFDLRREDVSQLKLWMQAHKINIYHSTPTVYRYFMDTLKEGERFDKVRLVVLGGEEVYLEDFERYKVHFSNDSFFVNGYGPTESTLTLQNFLNHASEITRSSVPLGYAVENTEIRLLNEIGQDAEVYGEIGISSPHIALRYWRKPEITEQAFIDDPDGNTQRSYRTGDMGRLLPDGQISFMGRRDSQVKIRGFRVELGEIETTLVSYPSIKEAAVKVYQASMGDKRIAAYLVSNNRTAPGYEEVRRFLAQKLPDYMLPASIQSLDALPMTPTGKLDRRNLPDPIPGKPDTHTFVAPRSEVEIKLAIIWKSVLEIDKIGVIDNFFELGGHSMLAVRVLAEIEKVFFQRLSLISFFQAPTIKQLASKLDEKEDVAINEKRSLVAIQPYGSKRPLYCIPGILGNVYTDLGALSQYLGANQPFYGFQDGVHNPSKIETLASKYINEIRVVQPQGPYNLAGICSGAIVAFEMANQLKKDGEKVDFLALVEPISPQIPGLRTNFRFVLWTIHRALRRMKHHKSKVSQLDFNQQSNYLRLKLKHLSNSFALRRYQPKTYAGQVHIYIIEENLNQPNSPRLRWKDWVRGGTIVHRIPGTHRTITGLEDTPIDPLHMKVLAEHFNQSLGTKSQLKYV